MCEWLLAGLVTLDCTENSSFSVLNSAFDPNVPSDHLPQRQFPPLLDINPPDNNPPLRESLLLPSMSDNGEIEIDAAPSGYQVLPKDVVAEIGSIKLFNKWSYEDVEIRDISLT